MITIRHTHQDGTLVEGTARGDGSAAVLKASGFRWFPSIKVWGVQGSRDRIAKRWKIEDAATALRNAGFEVEVEIDDTPRAHEEVRADRLDRANDREDALRAKADKARERSDAAYEVADRIAKSRPFGQPILVGHHSEGRARADQRRIERNMDKFCEERAKAARLTSRADAAGTLEHGHANPRITVERVERTEAELRRIQRALDGYTRRYGLGQGLWQEEVHDPAEGGHREALLARKALLSEQLRYDLEIVQQARAEGKLPHDATTVHVGDLVKISGQWRRIMRVNPKTVTVETGYSWTGRLPYSRVSEVQCEHGVSES